MLPNQPEQDRVPEREEHMLHASRTTCRAVSEANRPQRAAPSPPVFSRAAILWSMVGADDRWTPETVVRPLRDPVEVAALFVASSGD